jgi:tRNA modification GTPase
VTRARHAAEQADLRLHLVDASALQDGITPLFEDELLVFNKVDLVSDRASLPAGQMISCRSGEGLEALVSAILSKVTGRSDGEPAPDGAAINARHQECLQRAASALATTIAMLDAGESPELIAVELRASLSAVGEVVGEAGTEEILGKIFSSFCIGK